ncbi:hypothetical protein K523DRAFT_322739 [Schizophyllum commune Tattone D]|nr:hypothetical protein K523DRAFT_322739 [Schizophyllum commune Tattone D]
MNGRCATHDMYTTLRHHLSVHPSIHPSTALASWDQLCSPGEVDYVRFSRSTMFVVS